MRKLNNQMYPYYPCYPYSTGAAPVAAQQNYRNSNGRAHLISGLIAGAAVAYLLSNGNLKQTISSVANKGLGDMCGEIEELKEQLADMQAELDYYRQQKDSE